MVLDDGVTGRKADADSLADGLGGEERFEEFILEFQGDAAAGIFNHQFNPIKSVGQGFDPNGAVCTGGIQGVGEEVDNHLFELRFVTEYFGKIIQQFGGYNEIVLFFEVMLEDKQGVGDALIEIDMAETRDGGAAEGEQGLDDVAAAQAFFDNRLGVFLKIVIQFFVDLSVQACISALQSLRETEDCGEGIVDLMGDPGSQGSDSSHLFRLIELGL